MPTQQYKNKTGDILPSVTTVIGRFKDSRGLIHWSWKEGMEGRDYRASRDKAADAGTIAHHMIEDHIHKELDLSRFYHEHDDNLVSLAENALNAYLTWEKGYSIEYYGTEVPLVSEKYQFGGTIDGIAIQNGQFYIVDFKTSNKIYPDYLIQLAAYKGLWEENNPDKLIEGGFHLLRISKQEKPTDPVSFNHNYYSQLDTAWESFRLMRKLYENDKELKRIV